MPLPSRRKGEKRSAFVSRCVSFMTKKGEGKDASQRVAICNTRANQSLSDEQMQAMIDLRSDAQKAKKDKKKKKKVDKDYVG